MPAAPGRPSHGRNIVVHLSPIAPHSQHLRGCPFTIIRSGTFLLLSVVFSPCEAKKRPTDSNMLFSPRRVKITYNKTQTTMLPHAVITARLDRMPAAFHRPETRTPAPAASA